jgi:Domain of unknown function (DUF4252)
MRKFILTLALALVAIPAAAQQINLDFPGLAEKADEVVDVTLDASLLHLGSRFLSDSDPEQRAVRDVIKGLQGIYVRSYEFPESGMYDRGLADRVKSQLGANWKALVTVRSKTKENVTIYADMRGEDIMGLVIISAEPREFTVVNIVGRIDIDRLADLSGQFGIPKFSKGKDRD